MKVSAVPDYDVMSQMGADIIFDVIAPKLLAGKPCNLGLATGNTMITLYRILAENSTLSKLIFHCSTPGTSMNMPLTKKTVSRQIIR